MEGDKIRQTFTRFFEERGHKVAPSSSLISPNPSILFTTAGMMQFIPYFLGVEEPPYPRAVSAQKCFRANDIDNVGHTARHFTFFEMLGNFSFGDYFKQEAIALAFELVTEGYGIDPERLWATVYEEDQDSVGYWADVGIPSSRIDRRGKFDEHGEPANFWWTHTAGPCGPCSEIFIDRGPKYGPEGGPAVDEERFVEIWNLVFIQDECDEKSAIVRELPRKNIDTGSSLERVAMVLQDSDSAFDTDLLRPLVGVAESVTGRTYLKDQRDDVSLRVIADHGRAATFLIADGVLPSNEGRGYVLRLLLRRMVTHARKLGVERPVTDRLVERTVELMGDAYPELASNKAFILQVAASEEERFAATLRRGLEMLDRSIGSGSEPTGILLGDVAFKLHDTYGFPLELTLELAADHGLGVDTDGFTRLMDEQRRRAQQAAKKGGPAEAVLGEIAQAAGPTEFLGYEKLSSESHVVGLAQDGSRAETVGEGARVRFVLDRTPFYAEGGGQVGDRGIVRTGGGVIEVTDTRPGPGGTIVHEGLVKSGEVREADEAEAIVDTSWREATARSHTATHVLHHTVRQALGEHARQAGSLVEPGRLRFDFTHFEAVSRQVLEEIEFVANGRLSQDQPVRAYETTLEFARSEGAIALFGEKYGDIVRVVEVGDYSIELCGGTHVRHTGEVALIRLVSEGSVGAGLRRVEALTGPEALRQVNVERRLLEEVMESVGSGDLSQTPERVRQAVARIKQLESELGKIRKAERQREVERLASQAIDVSGVSLVVAMLDGQQADELRETAVALRDRLGKSLRGAAVLGTAGAGRALLVAACTNELVSRGVTAPALLEHAASAIGGGAGGKPGLAFAGGGVAEALPSALAEIPGRLAALLGAGG